MKRNEDRIWYDEGYRDSSQDTRKESIIPKLVGIVFLSGLLIADQYWVLAFVVLYIGFEIQEWHDLKKYHESDPPEAWE